MNYEEKCSLDIFQLLIMLFKACFHWVIFQSHLEAQVFSLLKAASIFLQESKANDKKQQKEEGLKGYLL